MKRKTQGTIIALISATALASAFAASATGTENNTSTTGNTKRGGFQRKELTETEKTEMQARMATDLAGVLGGDQTTILTSMQSGKSVRDIVEASGKDENTVMTALKEKRDAEMKTRLAADVASGKITQTQADEMLAHKGKRGEGHGNNENMLKDLASILGTDSASIKAKLDAGKTVKEVVTEAGFNNTDVRAKMEALRDTNMKARLAEEVSSGKITQAEADTKYAEMKQRDTERAASHAEETKPGNQ